MGRIALQVFHPFLPCRHTRSIKNKCPACWTGEHVLGGFLIQRHAELFADDRFDASQIFFEKDELFFNIGDAFQELIQCRSQLVELLGSGLL